MRVLGLDPGMKGAWAFLDHAEGVGKAEPLPMAGGELDIEALASIVREIAPDLAVVEKVSSMPSERARPGGRASKCPGGCGHLVGDVIRQGAASTFTFGCGYGILLGMLGTLRIRTERVPPQTWKKLVLAGTDRGKGAAIAYCRRAFPQISLVPFRCRVPHDGVADAICLAEFGRRVYGGSSPTVQRERVRDSEAGDLFAEPEPSVRRRVAG